MSAKTCKVKVFRIHGMMILARRDATAGEIRDWFEESEGASVNATDVHLVSLSECAREIEAAEFTLSELPMML